MPKRMLALAVAFVLLLLPAAAAHAQDPAPDEGTIYLQAGAFDPLAAPPIAAAAVPDTPSPYYLVQFKGPVEALWLEQVAALGGEVVGYIPNNTHIVRMAPSTVAAVQSLPSVRWVGPYRPAYKVAPELAAASAKAGVTAAAAGGAVELTVIAFPGESLAALRAALTTLGAGIVEAADTPLGPVLRIQAPLSLLPSMAQQPGVSWIERYLEPSVANAEGRKIIGAEAVWQSFGYYGSGQTIAISDSGLSVQGALSPDFAGRLVRAYAPSEMNLASAQCTAKTTFTDLNGHGTHVAGSVLGSGTRSGSNAAAHAYTGSNAGTAPEASLVFMALNTDGSTGIQCVDLNGDFLNKGYQEGARISSNSWGASDRGGYNQISSLVDDYHLAPQGLPRALRRRQRRSRRPDGRLAGHRQERADHRRQREQPPRPGRRCRRSQYHGLLLEPRADDRRARQARCRGAGHLGALRPRRPGPRRQLLGPL